MKDTYKTLVDKWIEKISRVQSYGHPICPYAKKARYHIFEHEDYLSMQVKALNFDSKNYDLYVCFPTDQWMTLEKAKYLEDSLNKMSDDTVVLLDHWKNPGFIAGLNTSNEKYIVFLIQDKAGLLKARDYLHTTTYYDNWPEDYYNKITQTGINKT